jgi:predicted  nucleic acid-binding Zn-ribbon protein
LLQGDDFRDKPALDAEIISLQQQISVAENLIPGSSRDNWKRLRGAHGPAALALIDGEFCVACSQKAIAQDLVRIRTGEIVFCRGCGRVLYQDL